MPRFATLTPSKLLEQVGIESSAIAEGIVGLLILAGAVRGGLLLFGGGGRSAIRWAKDLWKSVRGGDDYRDRLRARQLFAVHKQPDW